MRMGKRNFDFLEGFGTSNVEVFFPQSPSCFSQCHRSVSFKACNPFLIPAIGPNF